MLNIFWYFFIYAFLGWCIEVIYAAVKIGKFVNRGFLNGPYCPIYGVGVLLVLYLLNPVKDNLLYMFLGSVLITSTIELMVGFLLLKFFHKKWWDYSDRPFNIGGYICLMFSFAWGLACLVVVDRIHPLISSFSNWIPQTASKVLLIILACLMIVDFISTVKSILKLKNRLEIIEEISLKIRETSEFIGENLATAAIDIVQKMDDLEERYEATKELFEDDIAEMINAQQKLLSDLHNTKRELLEAAHFGHKRLLKAFPGLKSIDHNDALDKLRDTLLNGWSASNDTELNRDRNKGRRT